MFDGRPVFANVRNPDTEHAGIPKIQNYYLVAPPPPSLSTLKNFSDKITPCKNAQISLKFIFAEYEFTFRELFVKFRKFDLQI